MVNGAPQEKECDEVQLLGESMNGRVGFESECRNNVTANYI